MKKILKLKMHFHHWLKNPIGLPSEKLHKLVEDTAQDWEQEKGTKSTDDLKYFVNAKNHKNENKES